MRQEIKPIKKSFKQIVDAVAKYDPNPDKKLKLIKRDKKEKNKK